MRRTQRRHDRSLHTCQPVDDRYGLAPCRVMSPSASCELTPLRAAACITCLNRRDTLCELRSLRIDPELESRLQRAAAARGESPSEFIRRAAAERADATLSAEPSADFSDVLVVIHGAGGRAHRTGAAFAELLGERAARK